MTQDNDDGNVTVNITVDKETVLEAQNSMMQSTAVFEPGVFSAYGHAWKKLWKYFLELLLIGIISFAINLPASLISWFSNFVASTTEAFEIFGVGSLFVFIYYILITYPVSLGVQYVFLKAARGEKVEVGDMFELFKNYWNVVLAVILVGAIVIIGSFLLVIPGIIFGCKLAFVPYLVVDSKMEVIEAIKESWNMTNGHSWTIFLIGLLGIPISIAGLILLIVGVIPAYMWIYLAFASLYYSVSASKRATVY